MFEINMKKYFLIIVWLAISENAYSADQTKCFVEGKYEEYSTNHPLCLYYTGTESYRNNHYLEASKKWESLLSISPIQKEYNELFISAHNNLGYLYFHGLGVERNTSKSLEHWHKAVSLGHEESEYHLCYVYGDPNSPAFSPHDALPHCKKADAIYSGKKDKDKDDDEIIKIIRKYKKIVEEWINT
jgi:TPR repeat protein